MSRNRRLRSQTKTNLPITQRPSVKPGGFIYSEGHFRNAPLPTPEELESYNNIVSNGAERIFVMVENQTKHRINLETKVLESDISNSKLGLILGFLLQLTVIIGAIVVGVTRSMWEGILGAIAVIILGYLNFRLTLRKREIDLEEHKMLQNNKKDDPL